LLQRLFQLAGENAYLLLKVGNGWGCDRSFASFGPTHTRALDRLFASTASPHFRSLGWVTTRLNLMQILGFAPWQEGPLRGLGCVKTRWRANRGEKHACECVFRDHGQHNELQPTAF
jgi:hypothetical protein